MQLSEYEVVFELTEPLLGTVPKSKTVYEDYVREQAPESNPDETPPVDIEEKGWTGFFIDADGRPVLMDYQIKGFLKEAGNILKEQIKFKALRSHIDNEVFVFPRRIALGTDIEDAPLERPLRAMTMQGPRVSLMRSDVIPAGTRFTVQIKVLPTSKITAEILCDILDYGALKGLGQWRNGSYGRFSYTLTERG